MSSTGRSKHSIDIKKQDKRTFIAYKIKNKRTVGDEEDVAKRISAVVDTKLATEEMGLPKKKL